MPKTLIVYFSQAGSTAKVANAVATGLRGAGHEVDLHELTTGPPPSPLGYDAFGIGTPVYVFRPPFNVARYLEGLPQLNGLPVFVLLQSVGAEGDAGNAVRDALRRKGGREVGFLKGKGADYALQWIRHGILFAHEHPNPEGLQAAEAFGRAVAERVAGAPYQPPPPDPPPPALWRFARASTNAWVVRNVVSRGFRVRADVCTACGKCVEVCPTRNIQADARGRPVWGRDCIACAYCDLRCPVEAIRSPLRWPAFAPLLNALERGFVTWIPHTRVKLEGGEVKRIAGDA
jgi:flavodoxin/NAD-dependent dihydropyrimidine dehydrogenase PreA subunit